MNNDLRTRGSLRNLLQLKVIITISIQIMAMALQAQSKKNALEFSPQISLGVFTANGNDMTGTVSGGEIIYHLDTRESKRTWMDAMNLSSIDFVFNYKNMSRITLVKHPEKSAFGDSYAFLAALNLPLFHSKFMDVKFSPGFGLSYVGQTWFTNENPVIGSKVSFASRIGLKVVTSISSTIKLTNGVDILHYSNAGTRVPNNGMNVSSISIGVMKLLKSKPDDQSNSTLKNDFEDHFKRHTVDFAFNIGRRGVFHSKNGLYKSGLYAGYNYRLNSLFGVSTGVDAVYYYTTYDVARNDETYQSKASSFDRWRVGFGVGPDLWMGRTAIMLKAGYYLHYNSLSPINMYWTAGIKYHFVDWAAIQAKIYVHKTEADFVGVGFNFTL